MSWPWPARSKPRDLPWRSSIPDAFETSRGPPDKSPLRPQESTFTIGLIAPVTKPGTYDVYVSVGERDGTPTLALPLADGDGQRRYRLGKVSLVES